MYNLLRLKAALREAGFDDTMAATADSGDNTDASATIEIEGKSFSGHIDDLVSVIEDSPDVASLIAGCEKTDKIT